MSEKSPPYLAKPSGLKVAFNHIEAADGNSAVLYLADPGKGTVEDVGQVAQSLALLSRAYGNIVIEGAEPWQQPVALGVLVSLLKMCYKVPRITVHTTWTIEELCQPEHAARPFLNQIISYIDVLEDREKIVDVVATLKRGELVVMEGCCASLIPGRFYCHLGV